MKMISVQVLMFLTVILSAFGDQLMYYTADSGLKTEDGSAVLITGGSPETLTYIAGKKGRGLYLPSGASVSLPVKGFNPAEGTLSFWFRPDWSPPSGRASMIIEVDAQPAYRLSLRKGYPHVPDHCYLDLGTAGGTSFGAYNLFTGRTWRHYAIRWSQKAGTVRVTVDGDTDGSGGAGSFKFEGTNSVNAALLLSGDAAGAFDEVKVFDRWLDEKELINIAGLTTPATYLQRQMPPPGSGASTSSREVVYVDPATGQKTKMTVNEGAVYNPADMPQLPETPHTQWAKPLAGGAVKVLMIMPDGFYDDKSSLREGVELWQRLDMECDIVARPNDIVMQKDYDVIVVGHQGFKGILSSWWPDPKNHGTFMDDKVRKWFLDRITSGKSGLVLVNPKWWGGDESAVGLTSGRRVQADDITRGFPAYAMNKAEPVADDSIYSGGAYHWDSVYALDDKFFLDPDVLSNRVVFAYRDEKIRAVELAYRINPDSVHALTPATTANPGATLAHYDYWMALLARAVLFAAGREASTKISGLEITADKWKTVISGLQGPATLWYRARDIWDREYAAGEVRIKSDGEVTIPGLPLPPRAVVDLILRNKRGEVLDWFSKAVPAAVQTRLTGIVLDKTYYNKGATVKGTVAAVADTGGKYRLEVYLDDHEGRRLRRWEGPVVLSTGVVVATGFELGIPPSSDSLLMRVDAILYREGTIVDACSADCPVPHSDGKGFYAGMSGAAGNGAIDTLRRKEFRDKYGVNMMLRSGRENYGILARDNIRQIEYTTHLGYVIDTNYCMTTPEHREKFFPGALWCDPEKVVPFRPLFYSLGEEHVVIKSSCQSPTCTAAFQKHIQEKYGTLARLNAVWNTNYTSWGEVKMLAPDIVDVMKLKYDTQKFENRRFMEYAFADRHAYLANYFRKIDPQAEVGIHCGWELWKGAGYDYWLLSKGMESMIGYGGVQNQYIRSFFKNYYGSWWHYAIGSHEDARWHPWYMLFSGARGFGWFTMAPDIFGATTADLQLSSDFAAAAAEFTDAAQAGHLLAHTEYIQDQVAIHYSQDSFHAGVGPALSYIHSSFVNLLFDNGVPFRFVAYEQVAAGELLKKKPALFIMPHSISLSEKEVSATKEYVQAGGVLWADILPGTYDEFGRKLEQSRLAELFANIKEAELTNGAKIQAGACGKGKVILGDIGNYLYARNIGQPEKARAILDLAADSAGLQRAGRVLNKKDGTPAKGIWTAGYRSGNQRYLVVGKDYQVVDQKPADVTIEFAGQAHVYEMRSGRYLGYTDKFATTLETTRGKVFALLPYQVKKIKAVPMGPATRGTDLVLKTELLTKGNIGAKDVHLIRTSATAPNGKEVTALRRLTLISGGQGEIRLPVAYDDLPGKWTVHLVDTATGVKDKVRFSLQ